MDIPEGIYMCGIDCARLGEDSSVIIVVRQGDEDNKIPHTVVFIKEIKKNTMDALYEYVLWLHTKFNFRNIYVDETGLGAGLTDFLIKELNTPKFNKTVRPNYTFQYRPSDIVKGVTFTMKNKMDIFSHLKFLMERGMLRLPKYDKLIWQLQQFEYEVTAGNQLKLHHPDVSNARDDFCFIAGTKILTRNGQKNIETLKIDDEVFTRKGYHKILAIGSRIETTISRYGLTGTPNHPIITMRGVKTLNNLNASDVIYMWNEKQSSIEEKRIIDTLPLTGGNCAFISGITAIGKNHPSRFIAKSGWTTMGPLGMDMSYITETEIQKITSSPILNASHADNINPTICESFSHNRVIARSCFAISRNNNKKQVNGTNLMLATNGTKLIIRNLEKHFIKKDMNTNAFSAQKNIPQTGVLNRNSVLQNAKNSNTNAPVGCLNAAENIEKRRRVYNLTVDDCPEYFANNILVHNCDALALAVQGTRTKKSAIVWVGETEDNEHFI